MKRLNLWRREDGQTMAEYGVILAVITPAIVAAIALMSGSLASTIAEIASFLT
jgi:Flp pilus assembly pilin Flp